MRLLVTGARGMLGHDVARAAESASHELVLVDLPELDITDESAVEAMIGELCARPGGLDGIVNCAAFTDVDGAEDPARHDTVWAVNARGPGILARAAGARNVALVHVSTDYVFDGNAPLDSGGRERGYVESDVTAPRSAYGKSKLEGELQVLGAGESHTVVRTAWLYGLDGRNFVDTMLRLAGERESVEVVTDQVGCPTWSGHLAPALIGLLRREVSGIVHLAGSGSVSWNGFAREIFRQAEVDCCVRETTSEQFVRPAPRPAFSVLQTERSDVLAMPPWQDGLAGYLAARAGMMRT